MASRKKQKPTPASKGAPPPDLGPAPGLRLAAIVAWLPWVCLVALLPATFHNFHGWWSLLTFPGEANFGEGVVVFEAQRLARGENIYGDPSRPPYWICTYPPLLQLLSAPFAGAGFWAPRLISLFSSIGSVVILATAGRKVSGRWVVGLLAGFLWINSVYVDTWSVLARTDMLGRFLQSAAIGCLLFIHRPRIAFGCSLAAAVLAMLTKQNMFAAVPVCVLLLGRTSWRAGFLYAALWLAVTLALYGLLHAVTGGGFLKHVITLSARPLAWTHFVYWIDLTLRSHWPYLVAAIPGFVWCGMNRRTAGWLLACAAAGLPNIILSANDGSDRNYYYDFLWPLCLIAAIGVGGVQQGAPMEPVRGRSVWFARSGAVVASGCLLFYAYFLAVISPTAYPSPQARQVTAELIEMLAQEKGPVLCEYVGYTVAAGKEPDYLTYMMRHAEMRGQWNPAPMLENIRSKKYTMMMVGETMAARFSPVLMAAIKENYEPIAEVAQVYTVEGVFEWMILKPMGAGSATPSGGV